MRIYYIGDLDGHTDARLAGVVMSHGQAVDVHNEGLAEHLITLPWYSDKVEPAVAMADHDSTLFAEIAWGLTGPDDLEDIEGEDEED